MARFAHREHHRASLVLNVTGLVAVGLTLAVNLTRLDAIVSVAAALGVAGLLYGMWVRAGRPRGVASHTTAG